MVWGSSRSEEFLKISHFDLDRNQIRKAPSNFDWTPNLAFEPDLIGNLKLGKSWTGPYVELMWIQAGPLKIIWGSVLEINCHVQLRAFPGLRLFSCLSCPKNWENTCQSWNCKSCFSNKPPPLGQNVWGASASNFCSCNRYCSGVCCQGSLQVAWKKSRRGMENSKDRCNEVQLVWCSTWKHPNRKIGYCCLSLYNLYWIFYKDFFIFFFLRWLIGVNLLSWPAVVSEVNWDVAMNCLESDPNCCLILLVSDKKL